MTQTKTHALVVATHNKGKLDELRQIFADLDVTLLSLDDVGRGALTVVEDGDTFEANAVKKARAVAAATMMMTLADDSGLEVDALGGAPGVRSARYAHGRATDAENNAALLGAIEALTKDPTGTGAGEGALKARFRCVLALVDPFLRDGEPHVVDGTDRTMAELSEAEKNQVSHRAKASAKMKLALEKVLAERDTFTRRVSGE